MGTQQILLMILAFILVGVAIAVGLTLFTASNASSNKDAIINDLMNLGQYAYRFKLTPVPLGGGGRTYNGFNIPTRLSSNDNATYAATTLSSSVTITGTSKFGYGTISAVLDSAGILGNYVYAGSW